nr:TonB-dependent receptor [Gluconobacter aidae]
MATRSAVVRRRAVVEREASGSGDAVIVTGTHATNRRARDSSSPITVFSAQQLQATGELNLASALARVDPSITVSALGNDTAALTSSIRMRGLAPNEVLVLVDGKRRNITGNMADGSTPVDLNMIPANAIDHIEVLRDGAAAMYGSDAIAGVINIITKKSSHGIHTYAQTGANAYNGDGWQYQVGADGGVKWGNDGYVHISGQVYHADHSVVSNRKTYDHRWSKGDSWDPNSNKIESTPEETRENLAINWGKGITEGIQTYGLITYAHRHAEAYENYRTPSTLPEIYPYGFSPLETIEENNFQANLGLKGGNFLGFNWDLSTLYGEDDDDIGIKNTYNANYAKIYGWSPTTTRAATYRMSQWTTNLDLRRNFNIANLVPMTLAFGGEHRLEMYTIKAGNAASYLEGGTSGYAGISPVSAGTWQRNVWAGYIDGDFHPLKKWDLDFAGRFEHYTDAGNTETGKVTTRYDVTRRIAVRATISNGFRAPTLAEEHYSSLSVSPTGVSGTLGANSSAARTIGASKLKPERSTSVEGGIVLEPVDRFHISADVYQINIRDRILSASNIVGQSALDAISLAGVSVDSSDLSLSNIKANYYANAASTRTQGLDIQADYRLPLHRYGNLNLSMMLNLNRTVVSHVNTNIFGNAFANAQTRTNIQSYPRSKIVLNAHWDVGKWSVNVRENRYGSSKSLMTYEDAAPSSLKYSNTIWYSFENTPVWTTDLQVGYRVNSYWRATIGANNIFNMRPRVVSPLTNYLGPKIYDSGSTLSIAGGYYFARIDASF